MVSNTIGHYCHPVLKTCLLQTQENEHFFFSSERRFYNLSSGNNKTRKSTIKTKSVPTVINIFYQTHQKKSHETKNKLLQ